MSATSALSDETLLEKFTNPKPRRQIDRCANDWCGSHFAQIAGGLPKKLCPACRAWSRTVRLHQFLTVMVGGDQS